MYGTVARIVLKPGSRERFIALWHEVDAQGFPGRVAEYLYRSDTDPDELYLAVVFASAEAYRRNAESPAMDASYRRLRELMVADPEWHVVYAHPGDAKEA
jgi:quinol monooxygenase YgiN